MRRIVPILFLLFSCQPESPMTNRLANSSSPYLLQHADNPVDWYPWGEEALAKAQSEDKPILVSIGYSSCHWCHVMAHESFEDSATAKIMNEHFINIKIDREERPDIDQIYMDAVQKMGLNGGWPLNVFLTPDQKPFYGGTYFPKENWQKLLQSITQAFKENRQKIEESADQFTAAIDESDLAKYGLTNTRFEFGEEITLATYQTLERRFDPLYGGLDKSPKFPMPSIWDMLAVYSYKTKDEGAKEHLFFTLDRMADGGIYDHVGGGFSRYSVDAEWHVPHFEKMLYDNGQLLSLYATGYKLSGREKYKLVLDETIDWLEREMLDESGGFYAALDADSEGEEGKFYVWTIEEIESIAQDDAAIVKAYFDVRSQGNWEEGKNVLRRQKTSEEIAAQFNISLDSLNETILKFKRTALAEREKRIRPGLDSKLIAGWNGLTLTGLCHAYQATQNPKFLYLANRNAHFLKSLIENAELRRFPTSEMEGFLEDYAAVIQGFIVYYQTTFEYEYIELADELTGHVIKNFYDESEGFFYFTGDESEKLIARKKEVFDNVIPSSNSMMARNLFELGTLTYNDDYQSLAREMSGQMLKIIPQEPAYLSNWASLALQMSDKFAEIVIIGPEYKEFASEVKSRYLPSKVIAASAEESDHPIFNMKSLKEGKTTIFVCYNRACKLPVNSVEDALKQIK